MSNNFNLLASFYDPLGKMVYGDHLIQSQMAHLDLLPQNGEVLIIGGGSGRILPYLLAQKPRLRIHFVDSSKAMIALARGKLSEEQRPKVRFQLGTHKDLEAGRTYEAILCYFFLDLFKPQKKQQVFDLLLPHLQSGGLWLQADFLPAQSGYARFREKLMFLFFKLFSGIEADRITSDAHLFHSEDFDQKGISMFPGASIYACAYQRS